MSTSTVTPAGAPTATAPDTAPTPMDLAEKGRLKGEVISLDRRLFMKFTAFTGCPDPTAAAQALAAGGCDGALDVDANDPRGIGLIAVSEDPEYFVSGLRTLLNRPPFAELTHRPEFDMLGRSYSIGYEPDLEFTLLDRPRKNLTDPRNRWAVWYPLMRAKKFYVLPEEKQKSILGEHGTLAKRYGAGGHATDVRLACHGLDRDDNDFVIGLLGPNLHPLSAVVQEMRRTEQTSQYLDRLGPFFIGKVIWQSPFGDA
jgi:chlorite dismutase